MKSWFVYLINGKKIGTWANNTDEAKRNLRAEYGDVPMEFVGIMSSVDMMIATGTMNVFVGIRYGR